MKKVIITGTTGQDGSYMCDHLLHNIKKDIEVIGGIRRTSQPILGNISNHLVNPKFRLADLDINDAHGISNIIKDEQPDYFINLAASAFVPDSWKHPAQTIQTNSVALIHILEAVRKHAPHCRVYSSGSSEEFGDVDYCPQGLSHPLKPRSIYGVSKACSRLITKVYRESYGLYAVHNILFNHESPRRQEYYVTRKITKNVVRINSAITLEQKFEPLILGNILAKRDWSHAADFMDGVWRSLNQDIYSKSWNGTPKEYILASGETHTVKEFVELAFDFCNIPGCWASRVTDGDEIDPMTYQYVPVEHVLDIGEIKSNILARVSEEFFRPAEVDVLQGDSSFARSDLGWSPKYSFKGLVNSMMQEDVCPF